MQEIRQAMNSYKKKNEAIDSERSVCSRRVVDNEENNPCISETTGCPTKHDSW